METKTPMTLLSLTPDDRAQLKKLAENEGATLTETVRRLIQASYYRTFESGENNAN